MSSNSIETRSVSAFAPAGTRNYLAFYVNGRLHRVECDEATETLANFLRTRLRLTGTKICCAEGDCGSCTVLVGRRAQEGLVYEPTNACILFLFQVDGQHVVTVEGLSNGRDLNALQRALVEGHGVQCGFCTPGVVMALSAAGSGDCDRSDVSAKLAGNLCRCTGYLQILGAVRSVQQDPAPIDERYPAAPLFEALDELATTPAETRVGSETVVYAPVELSDALKFLDQHPSATVVAGATDLGVQINRGDPLPRAILSLGRIEKLREITLQRDRAVIGAGCTWAAINEALGAAIPQLSELLERFGAPQIRNRATIGGNLANGSPVADSLPLLYALGAEVEIASAGGARRTPVEKFYRGYKDTDLSAGELILRVFLPLPEPGWDLKLYKVSKRLDMDIATLTAAVLLQSRGDRIETARIAVGGAGPTVVRLHKTENALQGAPVSAATFAAAGEIAAAETDPRDDVRGSAEYRRLLLRNILVRFHLDCGMPH